MFGCLKQFWKTISTGWVLEYPDPDNGPRDFFERKKGLRWTEKQHAQKSKFEHAVAEREGAAY